MFMSHLIILIPSARGASPSCKNKLGRKVRVPRAGTFDSEPPVEESSQGNTLPPDAASSKNANRKCDGASTEKLQMLPAVNSLKRNLTACRPFSLL
nr:uncharacterized protein LOC127308537 [Lolium perenne]